MHGKPHVFWRVVFSTTRWPRSGYHTPRASLGTGARSPFLGRMDAHPHGPARRLSLPSRRMSGEPETSQTSRPSARAPGTGCLPGHRSGDSGAHSAMPYTMPGIRRCPVGGPRRGDDSRHEIFSCMPSHAGVKWACFTHGAARSGRRIPGKTPLVAAPSLLPWSIRSQRTSPLARQRVAPG